MSGRWDGDGWANAEPRRAGAGEKRAKGRKPFGATWWGTAWVDAIEHRASLLELLFEKAPFHILGIILVSDPDQESDQEDQQGDEGRKGDVVAID